MCSALYSNGFYSYLPRFSERKKFVVRWDGGEKKKYSSGPNDRQTTRRHGTIIQTVRSGAGRRRGLLLLGPRFFDIPGEYRERYDASPVHGRCRCPPVNYFVRETFLQPRPPRRFENTRRQRLDFRIREEFFAFCAHHLTDVFIWPTVAFIIRHVFRSDRRWGLTPRSLWLIRIFTAGIYAFDFIYNEFSPINHWIYAGNSPRVFSSNPSIYNIPFICLIKMINFQDK